MLTPPTRQAALVSSLTAVSSTSPLTFTASPVSPHPSIIYSLETYGPWETFTQQHAFVVAKHQYRHTFTLINNFIDQHCPHPAPIEAVFTEFLNKLEQGTLACYEPLLYGEGKKIFETFCLLLIQENLAREKKISAISQLAEELNDKVTHAINCLSMLNHQLYYATQGIVGEALRLREQLIQQFVQEFTPYFEDEELKKDHMVVYVNFLKDRYGLPSLHEDIHSNAQTLGISAQDLTNCLNYVEARLTAGAIISIMAKTYLQEVQNIIPEGMEVKYEIARACLAAVTTKLIPTYGDVPNNYLLKNIGGQYYAYQNNKLLQIALLQNLAGQQYFYQPRLLYHYPLPPHQEDIFGGDELQQPTQKAPLLLENRVNIYQSDTFYWVEMNGEKLLPTVVHLSPLMTDPALPFALIHEAIENSSVQELTSVLPLGLSQKNFFKAYIHHIFKDRQKEAIHIILNLFNKSLVQPEGIATALNYTLTHLGLTPPLIKSITTSHSQQVIVELLTQTLISLFEQTSFTLIQDEAVLCNLLTANIPLETKDNAGDTLLIHAARQGWLQAIIQLSQQGALINASNLNGQTAVMLAALHGHDQVVNHLFSAGARLEMVSSNIGNVLAHAIKGRHMSLIEKLLRLRAFHKNNHQAFTVGNMAFNPAYFDLNACDSRGRTALLWIFEAFDHTDTLPKKWRPQDFQYITKLLLDYGANIHARTKEGRSVLSYDQVYATDCFELLYQAGATPFGTDSFHILCGAITHNQPTVIKKLMQLKIPVHQPEDGADGRCPILEAVQLDRWEIALILLSHSQTTLTHHSRADALEIISNAILDNSIPQQYLQPLLYNILHPDFITQPDLTGQTFFASYLIHLQQIINCKETSLLCQYLQALCTHVDICSLLENGDTLLMYLIKNEYSEKAEWDPVFQYLEQPGKLLITHNSENYS